MDLRRLADELASPAYAAKGDAEVATLLAAPRALPHGRLLTGREVLDAFGSPASIAAWVDASLDTSPQGATTRQAAVALDEYAAMDAVSTAPGTPSRAAIDGLVAGGVLSDDRRNALVKAAETTTTRASELGLGDVTPGDVQRARGGRW